MPDRLTILDSPHIYLPVCVFVCVCVCVSVWVCVCYICFRKVQIVWTMYHVAYVIYNKLK